MKRASSGGNIVRDKESKIKNYVFSGTLSSNSGDSIAKRVLVVEKRLSVHRRQTSRKSVDDFVCIVHQTTLDRRSVSQSTTSFE